MSNIKQTLKIFATGWSNEFDGPGRRWVIYLKGCNFRCCWCANPESIEPETQILFYAERIKHIGHVCPYNAIKKTPNNITRDREICYVCKDHVCVSIWQHPAFEKAGSDISIDDIIEQAKQYRPLFGPHGGITFGGGEATLQQQPLVILLKKLRVLGIHTAIETNASSPDFAVFLNQADLLICDLKCVTQTTHQKWISCDNKQVLKNLLLAAQKQKDLIIRIPLIPGMNNTKTEIKKFAAFLQQLSAYRENLHVQVLRLHHLGQPKYKALGLPYPIAKLTPPSKHEGEKFAKQLKKKNIIVELAV